VFWRCNKNNVITATCFMLYEVKEKLLGNYFAACLMNNIPFQFRQDRLVLKMLRQCYISSVTQSNDMSEVGPIKIQLFCNIT
jgi:hypothetical protein